eukprot:TRINITY_DN3255_c0_g1::TRINITY_DN3255_c0_g1_i1::g.29706::m.29706 TRINITY_DN3255_c0_g1::TRINITY_DN3255_c0_g1_i1::g.29706  ORF type:complete len:190 (+),score=6.04,Bclx_interact/PF08945.5/0.14 TRINITY_DN3255_c0_g1_i1:210-779(+)
MNEFDDNSLLETREEQAARMKFLQSHASDLQQEGEMLVEELKRISDESNATFNKLEARLANALIIGQRPFVGRGRPPHMEDPLDKARERLAKLNAEPLLQISTGSSSDEDTPTAKKPPLILAGRGSSTGRNLSGRASSGPPLSGPPPTGPPPQSERTSRGNTSTPEIGDVGVKGIRRMSNSRIVTNKSS